ncbi:response regulator [Roseibium sp.]|uniref:hybrid sensor histidine kinase/response regulator n=1 Tax=Roseibium sp. TaxID=1936156 RepID=UPI003A98281A
MTSQTNHRADLPDMTLPQATADGAAEHRLQTTASGGTSTVSSGPGDLRSLVWPSMIEEGRTIGSEPVEAGDSAHSRVELRRSVGASAKIRSERRGEAGDNGLGGAQAPTKALMMLSVVGAAVGAVGAIALVASPGFRLVAIALAFFAGAMAVWRLMADDQHRAVEALEKKDAKIRRLMARCEELEDGAWELRESDERQASILSTLGDIVIRRDTSSTVVYANTAAQEAFGQPNSPLLGLPLKLPRADANDGDPTQDLSKDSGSDFGDVRLQTKSGPRWFSRLDISVRDTVTDQPLIQTVLRDVTDRRMIEDELLAARQSAESSSEAKSRFLATVSHEIRTPLNGILGMAALLRDTRLTKEQTAYIEALETSGETLLLLIDEVLDFSKVEAGKLDIQARPTPLAPLAENVVELLAPKAQAKGLEIGTCIDPALPEMVTLDATRVRQILFNLAGNGVKFTDEGGVSITLSGRANPDGGCFIDIGVRDTGIGFARDQAERLFKEFEQIDHGPARKFDGTGLGLAIAQRLAKLMGGSITAEPGTVGGALFKVSLPVPENLRSDAEAGLDNAAGKKIVIASNGRIEAPLLAKRMSAQDADVRLCLPGSVDMPDLLAEADLVIVDNSAVPDSGGWLASARLAGCSAPAVVMVSPPERDRLDRLREAGFAAYLIRPVRMDTLSQVISGLLGNAEAEHCWDVGNELVPQSNLKSLVPARPLRLLVAEDNDINRLLSEALLRKLGHEPVMVVDGEKAVEAASGGNFDAVLMDLHMPGLDGIGAIRQIRAEEAENGRDPVPILMVTADVMQDARDKAAAVGAAGYLTKPLSAEAISEALDGLARKSA